MCRVILIIQFVFFGGILFSQCDTLVTEYQAPLGMKLNVQSHITNVPSDQDLEISMIIQADKTYTLEVIGHRKFEVYILTTRSLNGNRSDRTHKQIILTDKEEPNGSFSVKFEKPHQLYVRLKGVENEKGNECTGVMVYEKE